MPTKTLATPDPRLAQVTQYRSPGFVLLGFGALVIFLIAYGVLSH